MTDRPTLTSNRRTFLSRLLTTTSIVATGIASRSVWAQSHHGAHAAPRVRTTARAAAPAIVTPPTGPAFASPPAIVGTNGSYALNVNMRLTSLAAASAASSVPMYVRAFVDPNNTASNLPLVAPTITIQNNGGLVNNQPQNVSIALTNNLPAEPTPDPAGAVTQPAVNEAPHGFNSTNLHTHGLHVDPLQDNVYLELQPAANAPQPPTPPATCAPTPTNPVWVCNGQYTYSYKFGQTSTGTTQIPAGTYWYHPHKHGSVGVQVASGMAGAFVVRGDLDNLAGVSGLTENVMVVQYIPYTPLQLPPPFNRLANEVNPANFYGINTAAPTPNTTMTINGQINPVVSMSYGQIQRWRIVNATAEQFFYLQIAPTSTAPGTPAPPQLFAIAVDGVPLTNSAAMTVPFPLGVPLATPVTAADAVLNEVAILAPGQRLDLLVQLPALPSPAPAVTPTSTFLVNAVQWTAGGLPPAVIPSQTIATISATSALPSANALPASALFNANATTPLIRPSLPATIPTALTQNIQFGFLQAGNGAGAVVNTPPGTTPSNFAASPFTLPLPPPTSGPLPAQLQLKLNNVDLWQVTSDPTYGFGPHAFHIHINSFMMTQRNGIDISAARIWRDTVRIEQQPAPTTTVPNPPVPTVQFVSQQVDYTGDFVLHCHVLEHEDAGMMWSVNIS